MLEGMRAASKNWVGKTIMAIVMGFIIFSFAIWGIGDIFRNFGSSRLAKVGDTEISTEAYRQSYQTELQRLQRQARRPITNEQARQMGLDSQVLSRLITEAALDQNAKTLGLAISDEQIAKTITADPTFRGFNGAFDKQRFGELLRDNGYNEKSFVAEQRNVYLRQEIGEAVTGAFKVPDVMSDAIHRYSNETRSVDFFTLPASAVGTIAAPAADVLNKYFDERKASFRAPEYRKIATLAITPASVAKLEAVTEAEIAAEYARVKGERYGTAEKRHVQVIPFATAEDAIAGAAKLKAGTTFEALAAERKLDAKEFDLGLVTQKDMIDADVAKAAFAMAANSVSEPIKGKFSTALARVLKIEPEKFKPLAEVSADLRKEVALSKSKGEIDRITNLIEDQRSAGKPLAEAAAAAGLKVQVVDGIDALGRDKTGKAVDGLTDGPALLKAAFASDIGVDNDVLNTKDGGHIWFEVANVEAARDRKLDEVKAEVENTWKAEETSRLLLTKAVELVKKLQAGEKIEDLAKASGAELKHANDVRRTGSASLSQIATTNVFNLGVKGAGSAADEKGRTIFKVIDSVVPARTEESTEDKALALQVKNAMMDDLLAQYVTKIQTDMGINVNQAAFRAAAGGSAEN